MKHLLLTAVLLTSPALALAQGILQNIQTAATIDMVLPFDLEHSGENRLGIRSAELIFYGPLDPTFDATLNLTAHNDHGEFTTELHEGFISSSKLIPQSRLKAGLFLLGVGRLNQKHSHDWIFVSAPEVHHQFFGDEGIADTGVEFSTLLPTESFWELTLGITNGYQLGQHYHDDGAAHSHDPVEAPHVPTHYAKLSNFLEFENGSGLQWGMSYLGNTDAHATETQLVGMDFVYKISESKYPKFLVESEIWYRKLNGEEVPTTEDFGLYIYPQFALTERVFLGTRFDLFSQPKHYDDLGDYERFTQYAAVPTLTYKHSEFTLFRLAYTYASNEFSQSGTEIDQKIELQLISILGAHPAHIF